MKNYLNRRLTGKETAGIVALLAALAGLGYFSYTFVSARILEAKVNAALPSVRTALREQRRTLVGAIEAYKAHFGFYPPDHIVSRAPLVVNAVTNPLLYELAGVILNPTNQTFKLGSFESADATFVKEFFHSTGFTNCAASGHEAMHFLSLADSPVTQLHDDPDVFAVGFQMSLVEVPPETVWEFDVSPWRYLSTAPTNNPGKFDLWIELSTKNQTITIGNWPQVE